MEIEVSGKSYFKFLRPKNRAKMNESRANLNERSEDSMKVWDKLWISKICIGGLVIVGVMAPSLEAGDPANEGYINRLSTAIYIAEGGKSAKKPFGILSVPCGDYKDCERICRNTIRKNIKRWEKAGMDESFISFLGKRYAPRASHPLNQYWAENVKRIMLTQGKKNDRINLSDKPKRG